ncbi:Glucose/ribitol dehydrogenase [Penicillium samsonianum]|uniref:Glucose/ribitol dehydrogenase n=1 Tax=Penicillium samsonianum TaxID=1882272 RepID=UPI0025492D54|nr:Glucose/ribitol dehydrogenase [Penicillium samsonianum]KAJ6149516.1 Glucose/ribitol dehydrogenase [Penicillium samsonianum]
MASRSQAKAEAVIKTITDASKSKNTSGKLKFLHLDLNDLLPVKAAAESFAQQEDKLDLRAAAASGESGKTRVVWTSSGLAEAGSPPNGVNFDLLDKGTKSLNDNYGTSKAGTWFLSREFARRYAKDGIVSVCLNPGYLKTASFNGTPAPIMFVLNKVLLGDAIYGAYTELYAGLSSDIALENSGSYIIPWGRIRPNKATPRQDLIKAGDSKEGGSSLSFQT